MNNFIDMLPIRELHFDVIDVLGRRILAARVLGSKRCRQLDVLGHAQHGRELGRVRRSVGEGGQKAGDEAEKGHGDGGTVGCPEQCVGINVDVLIGCSGYLDGAGFGCVRRGIVVAEQVQEY